VLVGVLALQGDVAEHRAALADLVVESRPVRRPDDLAGLDGIVLPGGESTTVSMLLDSSGLACPLGKEIAAGLPTFGTCAGMILLAAAISDGRPDQRSYGAIDIVVRRNGYGRQLDSFEGDVHVRDIGDPPFHGVFIRAPVVEWVGEAVDVLAEIEPPRDQGATFELRGSDSTAVVLRQGSVLVAAFHPELTPDRRLHELFVDLIEGSGNRTS
jgi:pyridoxal 5'-phosphate synthase pdxT subunit